MRFQLPISPLLVLAGLLAAGAAQAQQTTSNLPSRSGEASTMTNGVPNLLTSNVQPGELGIQSRLTVRRAGAATLDKEPADGSRLKLMGAAGAASASAGPTAPGEAVR